MRVDRAERRGKRVTSPKKPSSSRRKTVRQRATSESSPWYEKAALSVGISAKSIISSEESLKDIPGVTTAMLVALGKHGIKSVEHLAGCATDDLDGWSEYKNGKTIRRAGILDRVAELAGVSINTVQRFEHRNSDVRTAEDGSAQENSVNESAKVVLTFEVPKSAIPTKEAHASSTRRRRSQIWRVEFHGLDRILHEYSSPLRTRSRAARVREPAGMDSDRSRQSVDPDQRRLPVRAASLRPAGVATSLRRADRR